MLCSPHSAIGTIWLFRLQIVRSLDLDEVARMLRCRALTKVVKAPQKFERRFGSELNQPRLGPLSFICTFNSSKYSARIRPIHLIVAQLSPGIFSLFKVTLV